MKNLKLCWDHLRTDTLSARRRVRVTKNYAKCTTASLSSSAFAPYGLHLTLNTSCTSLAALIAGTNIDSLPIPISPLYLPEAESLALSQLYAQFF